MKRKRTYRAKTTLQNNAAAVMEEPETNRSRKSVYDDRMEYCETPRADVIRDRQTDLEMERIGQESIESYPDVLGKMIATIIREISKDTGGLANLLRSLVGNSVSNAQMGQLHLNEDHREDESQLHQNPEYNKPELNAALAVIKKTMRLDASYPFNSPVDPIALGIPDYFSVIDTPMDFGTICNNLENGLKYMNSADVFKDIQYIWNNCINYNKKGDHILELMKRVKTYFMKYWKAAGLQMEQSPDSQAIVEPSFLGYNGQQKGYQLVPVASNFTQLQQNEAGSNQVAENQGGPTNMQAASNFTQLQQTEAGSNQVAENRYGPTDMQADQPHQSSSQPQPSSGDDEPNIDFGSTQTRHRGPTRGLKLLKTEGRIKIVTNEHGEPVGPESTQLTSFLGLTARDENLAPLTYPNWSKMPKENKENMWQKVLTKFDIDPSCRSWVLASLRSKWRNFKFYLKANHYDTHATDEERLADRDERVPPDQWAFLVSRWSSEEWQSISARNKAKRALVKFNHTSGTKSFARIHEEEREKRPDGQEPTRAELFIMTRTRKDGQPVNEKTAAVISQLRESTTQDDAFNRVMGLDGKGSAPLYGTKIPTRAEALRMVTQKNAEVVEMKERLASVEQTCSQMASQMSAMMSMMATLQKDSPGESFPNAVAGTSVPVGMPSQSEPTSTPNREVPAKKTRGRKKRI